MFSAEFAQSLLKVKNKSWDCMFVVGVLDGTDHNSLMQSKTFVLHKDGKEKSLYNELNSLLLLNMLDFKYYQTIC